LGQWTGASSYSCPPYRSADFNRDCNVNGTDLAIMLAQWEFGCPSDCNDDCGESAGASGGGGGEGSDGSDDAPDDELLLLWAWLLEGDYESMFAYYGLTMPE
jgi:hypothetical protein